MPITDCKDKPILSFPCAGISADAITAEKPEKVLEDFLGAFDGVKDSYSYHNAALKFKLEVGLAHNASQARMRFDIKTDKDTAYYLEGMKRDYDFCYVPQEQVKNINGSNLMLDFDNGKIIFSADQLHNIAKDLTNSIKSIEEVALKAGIIDAQALKNLGTRCSGFSFFNKIYQARQKNSLLIIEKNFAMPSVYHTLDERMEDFRKGRILSYLK